MTHSSLTSSAQAKIELLASQILLYKELYYLGKAAISDEAYDALENELRALAPHHPALSFVGYKLRESSQKVPHRPPMLSLAKTYESSEIVSFADGRELVVSDKVDGMAMSLEFDFDGCLMRASTRGSGTLGEDVSAHVMHVLSLPKQLKFGTAWSGLRIEVRGEMYFPIKEFQPFSERFDSYRNAVPGTFGRKEVDEAIDVLNVLRFRAYDFLVFRKSTSGMQDDLLTASDLAKIEPAARLEKYFGKLNFLQKLGFDTGLPESTTRLIGSEILNGNMESFVAECFQRSRDHQIDGLVLRINDEILFEALGTTSHHPRGSIAFKQESESAVTEILAIETSIGRSGKVTFRAQVRPVQLSGAQISFATLHNAEFIRAGGYAPGAHVRITRSGEVIPSIIGLEKPAATPYEMPTQCPCGYDLTSSGPDLFCSQPNLSCPSKDQESFLYFAQTLEILGLSERTVSKLREAGLLKSPADYFRLQVEDVQSLEGFARRSAENLIASIQQKKNIPLSVFLASLGLKRGGLVKCREVAAKYSTLENVLAASAEDLAGERGWAEKSAKDFVESLHGRRAWIDDLLTLVTVEPDTTAQERAHLADHPLSGKTICITGTLSQPREIYARKLERVGAKVASSVTSKTHYLVCNEESGSSKFVQAKKLGIPILNEDRLQELLGQ
ncbi:NAD-dependent DNA ligase LigA [bacterium]|nr:NAD-dependent DNA ligase LigA [bacterium]